MADQKSSDNQTPNLIFDWKNPSMSTSSTSRMQEDARKAREESRARREQAEADVMEERKAELLEKRRAQGQQGRNVKNAASRTREAAGTAPRRAKNGNASGRKPAGNASRKKGRSFAFPVQWIGIAAAAVVVLILLVWGISRAPGGVKRKVPLIDKSLPSFVTEEYLTVNSWSRPGISTGEITGIVIHYTAAPGQTAKETRDYFESLAESHETRASSNFVIGLDGEIITCVPLGELAYASNSRNMDTVSIECCHAEEDGAFTEETYASLLKLTRWLMERYNLETNDVLRHYDVTGKLCPKYFVDQPDAWDQFLSDLESADGGDA